MEEKNKFVEMLCPVCGKYMFVDDTDLEKEDPDYEGKCDDFCVECGWQYDLNQTNDPDLKNGKNTMSLNEYKAWYMSKVEENPNYSYLEEAFPSTPHMCPVCGEYEFPDKESWEVCPVCGWVDDEIMEKEPDKWAGNANDLCLNDFKKRYNETQK